MSIQSVSPVDNTIIRHSKGQNLLKKTATISKGCFGRFPSDS